MADNDIGHTLFQWLIAEDTVFWLSWGCLIGSFLVSLWIASRFYGIVKEINAAMIFAGHDIPEYKIRKPIINRIQKLERKANRGFAIIVWRSLAMIFFGMIIPGLLLSTIVHFQSLLLPGPAVLMSDGEPMPQELVSYPNTALFVLDQALRGGLNDFMEVFNFGISPITNNPDQGVYSVLIFIFRLTCGVIASAVVFVIYKIITGTRSLNRALTNLQNQLTIMDAKNAAKS